MKLRGPESPCGAMASEPVIGRLTSIRLPVHIASSPALTPTSPAKPSSPAGNQAPGPSAPGATEADREIQVSSLIERSATINAHSTIPVLRSSTGLDSHASPETRPSHVISSVPGRRSRDGSTGATPNLHPAATPLCRFSFYGSQPQLTHQTLLLPPTAYGVPPEVAAAPDLLVVDAAAFTGLSLEAHSRPRRRARTGSSSMFAPNLGGGGADSSSDESAPRGSHRAPSDVRIARLRAHSSSLSRGSPRHTGLPSLPPRDALMAIAMVRGQSLAGAAARPNAAGALVHSGSSVEIARLPSIRERERRRTAAEAASAESGEESSAAEHRREAPRSPRRHDSRRTGGSAPPPVDTMTLSIGVQTDEGGPVDERPGDNLHGPPKGILPSALARMAPSKRVKNLALVALITLGCGFTMFVNGIAGRILPPRPNAYTGPATPLALRIVASLPDPLYVLTSGRGISLLLVLAFMLALARGRAQLDEVSLRMLLPVLIGVLNGVGYCFFVALCAMGNVAIWSAMLAVWIVVPLSYGILVRHESAGIRKVAGAVCCMVAAIILGLAGSGEGGGGDASSGDGGGDPEEGPIWLKLCLFLATVTSWSISDTLSAYVMSLPDKRGRSLGIVSVALFTAIGYLLFAWIAAGVSFLLSSLRPPVELFLLSRAVNGTVVDLPDGTALSLPGPADTLGLADPTDSGTVAAYLAPAPSSVLAGNALMFAGNLAGALSWYGIVLLGGDPTAEASSFLPLTALDAFIPAILGTIFLGEPVGAMGVAGMVIGAGGVFLVASSEGAAAAAGGHPGPPPARGAEILHEEPDDENDDRRPHQHPTTA